MESNEEKKSERYKRVGKQLATNVGAAGIGSAVGYYGAGTLLDKARKTKKVQDFLSTMPKKERIKALQRLRAASQLAQGTAGGLSAIALYNAFNNKDSDSSEKVAQFCIMYTMRRLV